MMNKLLTLSLLCSSLLVVPGSSKLLNLNDLDETLINE
jgi:hypothetical protein